MESGEKSLAHLLENRQDEGEGPFPPDSIHKVGWDAVSQKLHWRLVQDELVARYIVH